MSIAVGSLARLSPGIQHGRGQVRGAVLQWDMADSGPYRVAGSVVIDGTPATPVRRRVRLFDVQRGRLAREVWSNLDGTYEFPKVRSGPWLVIVDDYTQTYEADAATMVMAVP